MNSKNQTLENAPLPVMFFLSLTEDDIQNDKRESFELIKPSIKSLVDEYFNV